MRFLKALLGFSTLVFIAGVKSEQLSAEAQVCYDAFVAAYDPVYQVVKNCREKYPKNMPGEIQRDEYSSCTYGEGRKLPEFKRIEENCENEHFDDYTRLKSDELQQRVQNYFLERGLDLDTA